MPHTHLRLVISNPARTKTTPNDTSLTPPCAPLRAWTEHEAQLNAINLLALHRVKPLEAAVVGRVIRNLLRDFADDAAQPLTQRESS